MKPIIYKQSFLVAIFLLAVQFGYSQQKVRTSERPFNKDAQKAKLQEQRNNMVRKMGNRQGLQNHQKPSAAYPAVHNQPGKPVSTKPTINQVQATRKPTLLN
jgi:hypothetical protein